jgi:hypothetical protein
MFAYMLIPGNRGAECRLPHDRSEFPQLAQEEWVEDDESPYAIVRAILEEGGGTG